MSCNPATEQLSREQQEATMFEHILRKVIDEEVEGRGPQPDEVPLPGAFSNSINDYKGSFWAQADRQNSNTGLSTYDGTEYTELEKGLEQDDYPGSASSHPASSDADGPPAEQVPFPEIRTSSSTDEGESSSRKSSKSSTGLTEQVGNEDAEPEKNYYWERCPRTRIQSPPIPEEYLSVGSMLHNCGQCTPCELFLKKRCALNAACPLCHAYHPELGEPRSSRNRPNKQTRYRRDIARKRLEQQFLDGLARNQYPNYAQLAHKQSLGRDPAVVYGDKIGSVVGDKLESVVRDSIRESMIRDSTRDHSLFYGTTSTTSTTRSVCRDDRREVGWIRDDREVEWIRDDREVGWRAVPLCYQGQYGYTEQVRPR